MKKKSPTRRVDLQVTALVTFMVVISSVVVFFFAYTSSYNQMINSLEERVHSIAAYIDNEMPSEVFYEISEAEDMNSEVYNEAHNFLSDARQISSAQYLYTATRNADGNLIYHIDGLPIEDADFRKPGDLIEPDFQEDLATALTDTIVMPGVIKNTEWGDVFVAYYPLHAANRESVIGAIGIEFPASLEYEAYRRIRLTTPFVILFTCVITAFLSHYLFNRISNPHFKDLSNTDSLTGLKNRNAYDLDIENLISAGRINNHALVLADLNALKSVNDKYGHKQGDEYIKCFAKALIAEEDTNHIPYRIGGDEFAVFFFDPTEDEVRNYISKIKQNLKNECEAIVPFSGVAVGYNFCDKLTAESWEETQVKADVALYSDKKAFYESNIKFDKRK